MKTPNTNKLDYNNPLPLYFQLQEILKNETSRGTLANKTGKIPTEKELSKRFKVSRITVRAALDGLQKEGLLTRRRGSGTFINANKVEHWKGHLLGFSEALNIAGYTPGARAIKSGIKKNLSLNIKEQLELNSAWEIKRIRYADQFAIALEHSYFPIHIGFEFEKNDLDDLLIYNYIEQELNISLNSGRQTISAVNADEELANLLNVSIGEALIYVKRLTCSDDGKKVEYLIAYYRPDFFQYNVHLQR